MLDNNNKWTPMAKRLGRHTFALSVLALSQAAMASTALENNAPLTGLRGAQTSETFYTLDVTAGASNLNISINDGTGDADLYVKYGSAPTSTSYDCRPYVGGNTEACDIATIQTGTYHVMVKAYSAYSGLTLSASFNEATTPDPEPTPTPGAVTLENGVSLNSLTGGSSEELAFVLDVPAGASNLSFTMSGGSGDADLHVKFGSAATTGNYDCRPYQSGNEEACAISNIQQGNYHVMVRGYSNFAGISLVGAFDEAGTTPTPDPDPTPDPNPNPSPTLGIQNAAAAGDSITRAFAADCTYNSSWWGLLCPAGADQEHHSWFDGTSPNVNSVHDRYKALDGSIGANKDAATTGAEMVGLREDGPEPSFGAQAQAIVAQSPLPDHVELIFGGNDLCSRDCVDPANCADPIYTGDEWRQALRSGLNTMMNGLPQGSSILMGSVPRVQDIRDAGLVKQAADEYVMCESIWTDYDVCSIMTQTTPLNGETQAERAAGVAAAQKLYNAILAEEATAYNSNSNGQNPNGIEVVAEYVDENTFSGGTAVITADKINGGDCFHPTVAAQGEIADYMWNANTDKNQ